MGWRGKLEEQGFVLFEHIESHRLQKYADALITGEARMDGSVLKDNRGGAAIFRDLPSAVFQNEQLLTYGLGWNELMLGSGSWAGITVGAKGVFNGGMSSYAVEDLNHKFRKLGQLVTRTLQAVDERMHAAQKKLSLRLDRYEYIHWNADCRKAASAAHELGRAHSQEERQQSSPFVLAQLEGCATLCQHQINQLDKRYMFIMDNIPGDIADFKKLRVELVANVVQASLLMHEAHTLAVAYQSYCFLEAGNVDMALMKLQSSLDDLRPKLKSLFELGLLTGSVGNWGAEFEGGPQTRIIIPDAVIDGAFVFTINTV
jgi:hypothetical protein